MSSYCTKNRCNPAAVKAPIDWLYLYALSPAVDVDECASAPCPGDQSTCEDLSNMYQCNCFAGFEGTHCTIGRTKT